MKTKVFFTELRDRWHALKPGEQAWIAGAAWVLGVALLVLVLIAPALRTLSKAQALQRTLDAQLMHMQNMQAEAQALQSERMTISAPGMPTDPYDPSNTFGMSGISDPSGMSGTSGPPRMAATADGARLVLENSVAQVLGSAAMISVSGELATLTLRNARPEAFAAWLALARIQAQTLPSEMHLTRHQGASEVTDALGTSSAAGPVPILSPVSPVAGWDGTVVLKLPTQNPVSAQVSAQ